MVLSPERADGCGLGTVVPVTPRPRRAVCPGSYDPVTYGHLDVIERAAALHDEVVVAVLHNPAKAGSFTVDERIGFVERALAARGLADRVRVEAFAERLLVDVCRELGADVVVKGLRGPADLTYELPMALMNRHLTGVETALPPRRPGLRARLQLAGEGGRALRRRRHRPGPGRGTRRPRRPPA